MLGGYLPCHLGSTPFDLYCWVVNLPQGETCSGANKAVATCRPGANARGVAQAQVTGGSSGADAGLG